MKQSGYLLISDISGYTAFLTQSELEHAHSALQDLFKTLLASIQLPLKVAKLEGDAIFMYSPKGSFIQGLTLLEGVENLYYRFAHHRELMHVNTTCTCTACKLIPTLDLKFVIHYGEFIVGADGELSGSDVILIYRLLKNNIVETTGIKAYAYYTDTALAQMHIEQAVDNMLPHIETYEHLGVVSGRVADLRPGYEAWREQARVVVTPDDTWYSVDCEVPIPPALAWDYLHDPVRKRIITNADSMKTTMVGSRRGMGMENHCAHGSEVILHQFVDWRPFEYATYRVVLQMGLYSFATTRLTPTDSGTRVEWRIANMKGTGAFAPLLIRLAGLMRGEQVKADHAAFARRLTEMVQADLASGVIIVPTSQPTIEREPATIN